MTNSAQKQVIDLIRRSSKILILPSAPPDGDCIGSAIALYLTLKKLHKEATVVCQDVVPDLLNFLPHTNMIGDSLQSSTDLIISLDTRKAQVDSIQSIKDNDKVDIIITPKNGRFSEEDISFNKGKIDYDLIITVDTAVLSQLGKVYENNIELFHQIPVINIDHHISNSHFGKINYVDIMSSSTTELLLPVIEELAKEEQMDLIDEDIATLLLTGIITDTGSFQNANTTPKSFAKAAQLIAYGARQQEIIQHIYKTKQLSQLKLWGRVLSKLQTDEAYRVVWSVVSQQDFKDTESTETETGDIIDELMTNAPGAEVILLMKERTDGIVSISTRTTVPSVDATKIAEHFGGGGHARAAGFRISGKSLRDAEYEVINYVRNFQKDRLGIVEEKNTEKAPDIPMIDVEKLMKRAKEAEKAQEQMRKIEPEKEEPKRKPGRPRKTPKNFNISPPKADPQPLGTKYKFED
ncbi:MAG: DHH family phosphoesterase [Candidatus Peregrinibacteria bacterium]